MMNDAIVRGGSSIGHAVARAILDLFGRSVKYF